MVAARLNRLQIDFSEPAGGSPAPELLALASTKTLSELMRRLIPRVALFACSLGLGTLLGCSADAIRRTAPAAEARFAEQYIRALHDSGVAGIIVHSQPGLVAKPDFQESVETLRKVLQTHSRDSLVLSGWERERRKNKPNATKIVYDVVGLGAPFQIGIWIEEENGRLLANTLFFGPPKTRGAS